MNVVRSLGTVDPLTRGVTSPTWKRRRPSGEPPPLPHNLQMSGKILLAQAGIVLVVLVLVALVGDLGSRLDRFDSAVLQWISGLRSTAITPLMRDIDAALADPGTLGILRWGALLSLVLLKRFRHLMVFAGCLLAVGFVTTGISLLFVRARPIGVDILGHWEGASLPSRPVAALAVTLCGIAYTFIVPGRPRNITKTIFQLLVLVLGFSRLYLAVDHPTDVLMGAVLGFAFPVLAFRIFVPNEVFPVTYRGGRTAHLDVGGERGEAIRRALDEQLGISVIDMKPFGLGGSGGSTPLRLRVADQSSPYLFAKLYAANHLRADRWFKLGRALLYGRLEDEASFSTVRRLVQYEDYMLLSMRKAGLPVPEPYGFVEITPEREYLIVTDFVEGAQELLEAEVDDAVIDEALSVMRQLWDAGLAHRDIKPSNLLVRDHRVYLIDVAFGQVRPSPWRQAVDLANMMLVLALRSDPDHVYARALRFFSPEDIAEAFAATRGVTMPSQSRNLLRRDRRGLVARFRELAPAKRQISIQRWSWRRVALTAGVVFSALLGVQLASVNLQAGGLFGGPQGAGSSYAVVTRPPECGRYGGGEQLVLQAQSVPTASLLPCLGVLPSGWAFESLQVRDGSTRLEIRSTWGRERLLDVTLTRTCKIGQAMDATSELKGAKRYDTADLRQGRYTETRFYVFSGGCIRYDFDLPMLADDSASVVANTVASGLDFVRRQTIADHYHADTGLTL